MTALDSFFIGDKPLNTPLFIHKGKMISYQNFRDDVARLSNHFVQIPDKDVILSVADDMYLFCTCFMALLQTEHEIILPAMLNNLSLDTVQSCSLITTNNNNTIDCKTIIRLDNIPDNTGWIFKQTPNSIIHFFTSGSTGTPKKISKHLDSLCAEVAFHATQLKSAILEQPTVIASIAPHHMYGLLWHFLFPLYSGLTVDTDVLFSPEELQAKSDNYEKVFFLTTPSFLDSIKKYKNQYKFKHNFSAIITSGSMLSSATSLDTHQIFGTCPLEIYGSTETGGIASRLQSNGSDWNVFECVNVCTNEDGELVVDSNFSYKKPYTVADQVRFITPSKFHLLGRTDRIIKIAEERISLPEIEEFLNADSFIERSYLTVVTQNERAVLGAIIVLTPEGRDEIIKLGRTVFVETLRQQLRKILPPVAVPRKFRFVHQLPFTAQGKILKSDITNILSDRLPEPIIQNLVQTENEITANLTFLSESEYFKGHFPEQMILPGVIQLHFVIKFIEMFFNKKNINCYNISKLKFSNLILPNTTVKFRLSKHNENEFSFLYEHKNEKNSSGKIIFQES